MKQTLKLKLKEYAKGFNYEKYWSRREKLYKSDTGYLRKCYYKWYLRRINLRFNADINYYDGGEDNFKGRPQLGHGLNGIVIAGGAKIGKNCFISPQVTIGRSRNLAPVIGDNVYIGPGAKIFGGIKIGNNVRIGANCVVFEDVPDNATVVLPKPRIIAKDKAYSYYAYKE